MEKGGARHPIVRSGVLIGAGAKVLGSFTIGDNSKIGAGSVVLSEVPPNSTVVGVPGRVVKRDNVRLPQHDLDQVNMPDPVKQEMEQLRREYVDLHQQCAQLQQELSQLRQQMTSHK